MFTVYSDQYCRPCVVVTVRDRRIDARDIIKRAKVVGATLGDKLVIQFDFQSPSLYWAGDVEAARIAVFWKDKQDKRNNLARKARWQAAFGQRVELRV